MMATSVGINPQRLWYERNMPMTIECPQPGRVCCRFWTGEAAWTPHTKRLSAALMKACPDLTNWWYARLPVRHAGDVTTQTQGCLGSFDCCWTKTPPDLRSLLVMHSLLHEACDDALSRSRVNVPRNKYGTRKNCVKCFMLPTQDRVPMLSPHACVVRLGCSWTPQARQHAEVQDVDDSVAVEAGQDGSRHSCAGGNPVVSW